MQLHTANTVDDLTMSYSGNRLVKTVDSAEPVLLESSLDFASTQAIYSYDSIGRMTADTGRDIEISYNEIDRPSTITAGNGQSLTYTYAANGQKLAERYIRPMEYGAEFRYYIGPFELSCRFHNKPAIARINTRFGYFTGEGAAMKTVADYQGNIRAVVDASGNAIQTTDYYPYGLPMATSTAPAANPYKYSGKEFETGSGLSQYDFAARHYTPAVPIFYRPDDLAIKKPNISPYSYCNGDPINFVDPLGMDTINISFTDNKWTIEPPIMAEGDDVFIVKVGDKTETYTFSEGEYGKRVCALNLEIGENKSDMTLGVYHVSGSKNAHGYYVTPGGEASTIRGSGQRIPEGTYPITTPTGTERIWRCIGVGGDVLGRGIRFHYGFGEDYVLKTWTTGCFVLSTDYEKTQKSYRIDENNSKRAYETFGVTLGADSFYPYINAKGKNRIGTRFTNTINSIFLLKSR